jgi:transcriptional regulator with XRE-family HTH domain
MSRTKNERSDFGARLLALRKARGLSQVQLAERTGISQRAISSYETQVSYPPIPALPALAQALGVSLDELFGLKASKALQKPADLPPRWLRKKIEQIAALPERDQRAVLRLINSLVAARSNGGRR